MSEPGEPEGGGRPPTPPALVLSCAFGAVGVALLVLGALLSRDAVFVAGVAAGALSLGAALYWRSELVSTWAERKQGRRR